MKKTFNMFLVAVMAAFFAVSCTSTADRAHTLKVYNWADYVDESLIEEFEQWYEEQTGEQVKVIYETFDINENMLTKIEVGKEDYDVVCPSEYIIQRMLRNNLLQPIQRTYAETNTPDWTTGVAPFVAEKFQEMSPVGSDLRVSDYAVGYMGGTTGWLYNPEYVQAEDLQSWDAILNPKFEDKIYMKDAFRDVYSVLVLYAYRDSIEAGTLTRAELVRDITPERIAAVEAVLKQAKSNIAAWEVDFGKEDMVKGKAWINLSWSGDAQWAIDEAAESGVELDYIVPQEGSNVWYDGWVIPIYAKNVRAASY
ncbi:MAG: extracellular solute-binding protein, partial [Paludibacteraceae bacterium]|nr:extracellular solute-binding protein [Paludibacteraceae bacterium]